MNRLEMNFSDKVQVKLTQRGIARYRKHHSDIAAKAHLKLTEVMPELVLTNDGWCEFPLWKLMQIFGPEMPTTDVANQMFVNNALRIPEA